MKCWTWFLFVIRVCRSGDTLDARFVYCGRTYILIKRKICVGEETILGARSEAAVKSRPVKIYEFYSQFTIAHRLYQDIAHVQVVVVKPEIVVQDSEQIRGFPESVCYVSRYSQRNR